MAEPVSVNLTGWRNTPFPPRVLRFEVAEDPLNLTGKTFALDVRAIPGEGTALISLGTAPDNTAQGVRVVEAAAGRVRMQIGQTAMQSAWDAAKAAGLMRAGETAPLFYDLLAIDTDGFTEALIEGEFNIEAGVTL